jgi:hypothetical protein
MALAERVAAGDEGNRLLVVHRHAGERLPDIPGRGEGIRLAIRPFRIDVDQAHLNGGERIFELPVAAVALVSEPGVLRPPVDVLLGLPDILAPASEAEGLEPHRIQGDIAGENHQIGPGDFPAVFLLDRP